MLHEQHHIPPNSMRNARINMQQMGPPPNQRSQPMLMSIPPHTGVLVSMPPGPALISTTTIPQQQQTQQTPKNNIQDQHEQNVDHQTSTSNTSTSSVPMSLANTKEKTPMCLVNELARYNKIQHQYRLTGEQGPAHKKVFTVTLKLGNEEYEAEGASIKKAQHCAAGQALAKTEFKHPPPKTVRNSRSGLRNAVSGMVTPTVELNALAMKRGERTVYVLENGVPHHHHTQGYVSQPGYYPRHNIYGPQGQPRYSYDVRRNQNMRNHFPHFDNRYYDQYKAGYQHNPGDPYTVRLRVGKREYPGVGYTVQAARHDAAAKAIEDIKQMSEENDQSGNETTGTIENGIAGDLNSDLKSPISLVHEIALKRNLNIVFDVLSEKGPPHMKVFVTQCRVGDLVAEGEGNGKKISKKRAAEKMLEELAKLPPLPNINTMVHLKRKRVATKKKTRNLIKVNMDKSADYVEDINPISRLIQIQQANKEKEPVYTVLEERGAPRRREFVIEATVNGHSCTGVGPNKKIAKRSAAEALLALLGYSNPNSAMPKQPVIKSEKENENAEKARKVTFVEEKPDLPIGGSGGRQLVPGLLLVGDQSTTFPKSKLSPELVSGGNATSNDVKKPGQVQMAKVSSQSIQGVCSKDQLLYLAQLMNIQVQFTDFPKANHEMYLTLVSLSTSPAQVCHGEGPTTEASQENAASKALEVLSKLGLDIACNKETNSESNVHANVKLQVSSKPGLNQNGIKK